jgi:ABC-2 type transport system permease protein
MRTLAIDLLRSRRVLLLGVCGGLLLVSIGYLALYPSFDDQLQTFAEDLPDAYKALIGDADLASPAGYIRSQVYSLMAPLLISGAGIAAGSSLARSEREKTLATLAVLPLSRRRLAGAWWLLIGLIVGVCGVAAFVGVVVGSPLAGADVGIDRILLATIPMTVLGALVGTVALLVSSLTGTPGAATGVGWLTVAAAFLANSLAELLDSLSWLGRLSPWAWHGAGQAITGDFDVSSLLLLVVSNAVIGAVAVAVFDRRNLHL